MQLLPGIGVWTAAETMQRAFGDPDAVSVGDYNLPKAVGWALAGPRVDDDGMLALLYAMGIILLYVGFRFDFRFSPGVVIRPTADGVGRGSREGGHQGRGRAAVAARTRWS